MRTFYLFQIKDGVLKNYKNNYEELYNLLESIHYLKTEDIVLGFNIFDKIVSPMDKENVNDYMRIINNHFSSFIKIEIIYCMSVVIANITLLI